MDDGQLMLKVPWCTVSPHEIHGEHVFILLLSPSWVFLLIVIVEFGCIVFLVMEINLLYHSAVLSLVFSHGHLTTYWDAHSTEGCSLLHSV